MRTFGYRRLWIFGCATSTLLVVALPADAGPRRAEKPTAFKVALQPFSLVRQAVHAVADPIVENAPRAVARIATAPVRIAATTSRMLPGDERERQDADEPVYTTPVRMAQPIHSAATTNYAEPMRVAYVTSQPTRRAEPVPSSDWNEEADGYEGETPRDEQAFSPSQDYDEPAAPDEDQENGESPAPQWPGDRPTVSGSRAVLRNGIAYAPSRAPENVKNAIWAVNSLRRKPYVWGGGHRSFHDRGYDCSGAVSYALHYAGVLSSPMPSTGFMDYGRRGRGRWITIYSRPGHTFAVIAGLRLDTTDFQRGGNTGPRWHADGRDTDDFVARHPAGL